MDTRHLVIVPHTHWDREWYMPFERFRKRLVAMIDHLLELLENDHTFKYFELDGQTLILDDYLEIRPENEGRLRKFIENGRIIIGPWYVQPDEFLVTGESIVRNIRLGIREAKRFGKPSMIGYMPDQFGHIAQMPQILTGFGIKSAMIWRGVGNSVGTTQFLWESPDGTRLFTIYLADSYSHASFLPLKQTALKERLSEIVRKLDGHRDIESVLIMNGEDHIEPQDGLPAALEKTVGKMPDTTYEMGNFSIFIKQAKKQARELPVHQGEFRSSRRAPLLPGVTSARIRQKQRDFENCRLLEKYVEPLCTWATLCGDDRPHANFIDQAWRLTLQNHPHDSICGCSVDPVHEEMETRFDKAHQIARTLRSDALAFLAERIDSSRADEEGTAVVIYNPTSARSQVVDAVVYVEEPDFVNSLTDGKGRPVALQKNVGDRELFIGMQEPPDMIREHVEGMESRELIGYYINNILWQLDGNVFKLNLIMGRWPAGAADVEARKKELSKALSDPAIEMVDVKGISGAKTSLCFYAENLSPNGLSVHPFSAKPAAGDARKQLEISSEQLENDFYLVTVNEDGTLDILDKESGSEFRGCLRFVDEGDRGDSYNFDAVPHGEVLDRPSGPLNIEIVEDGPVKAALKLRACYRIPGKLESERTTRSSEYVETTITTLVSIYRDIKRIDFRTSLDNQCEDHRLRVLFNAPLTTPEIFTETAFGVVARSLNKDSGEGCVEQPIGTGPQKTFSCIEDDSQGVALFNRGVPEIEAIADKGNTVLALTLMRSVGWLSRDDLVCRPQAAGPHLEARGAQSKGPHEFEYAFTSYQGGFAEADVAEQAHAYAYPPIAIITNRHNGKIKDGASFVDAGNPNIITSAVELSRSKGASLVRLYNMTDRPQTARLAFWNKNATIYEVDFLEKKLSKEPLRRKKGRLELEFGPAEIRTLKIARLR